MIIMIVVGVVCAGALVYLGREILRAGAHASSETTASSVVSLLIAGFGLITALIGISFILLNAYAGLNMLNRLDLVPDYFWIYTVSEPEEVEDTKE